MLCGVMLLGLTTGCGNDKKEKQSNSNDNVTEKNKTITCVKEEKLPISAMDEDGEKYTLTSTNKIVYDKDMKVISASHEETEKFDNDNHKDRIKELKERYESGSKRLEEQFNGISSKVTTNETNSITNTMNFDYSKMTSEDVEKTLFKDYIDSNSKFDVDSFKTNSEKQNCECKID